MMKKIIYTLFILILLIGLKSSLYASDNISGDYTYRIENGYVVITGYQGNGGEITIPTMINGNVVKVIGKNAFNGIKNITKITMPDTIIKLEAGSFSCCESLEEIYISNTLQIIEQEAFNGCLVLKEINLPNTITAIGGFGCFSWCPSLTAINLRKEEQNGFFSIDGILFFVGVDDNGNSKNAIISYPSNKFGSKYVIPDFVTYVRYGAFSSIQNLEKLIIPASVNYFEMSAINEVMNPIDIIFKHINIAPDVFYTWNLSGEWTNGYSFSQLPLGSKLICRTEIIRSAIEKGIYDNCTSAVLATNEDLIPATGLELSSASEITLAPGESKYVSWMQIPEYTTDNITWKSSDPTGLTIGTTGKVTAIYRGTYTVTGEDESGNSISVKVNVSTLTDNGDILFYSNQNGTWQKHVGPFSVGETYELGFLTQFSGNQQGIYPGTVMISNWNVSGKHKMTTESVSYGQYLYERTFFTPYEAGSYKISFLQKDKDGIVLALGEAIINVVRDESKLFDLTRCFVELDQYNYSFSGKEIKPKIKGGTILGINQDYYNVTYEHNTFPGVGYVVISGKYGAKGTIREPFYIAKGITILSGSSLYTKRFGDKDFTLNAKANANQTLQYKSSNTKIADVSNKGKVTIKHAGTAVITVKVSGDAVYTDAEKKITIKVDPYKIGKVSLTVKRGNKKASLSWKPIKNASGYEIYRATTKNGKYRKIKSLKKGSVSAFTNNKLSRNKIYYYKVRAYRIVNKFTIYGAYSNPKK